MKNETFSGKKNENLFIKSINIGFNKIKNLLIIGVGKKSNISISDLQIIGANARNLANDHKIKNIYFDFDILNNENEILTILNSAILSEYKFNKYITKKTKKNYVESFNLIYKENIKNDFLIKKSKAVSSGICLARNLINESPSVLNPVKFAEIALKVAKQADLTISILDQTQIKKEGKVYRSKYFQKEI